MEKQLPVSVWSEWKIVEKIGEGSFGKVYKAQRTEKGKEFYSAIKIITIPTSTGEWNSVLQESRDSQSAKEYFQSVLEECIQEVSTMEYFRGNSYVVSVEDYKVVEYLDTVGWDIYIRMEYLTSFVDYCSGKQIQEEEVIQLGIDLCKALEYCQKLNIIHRDIKPENIFVSRFGEFKLGDFGIARELERSMGCFSKKGTYSYMAPEMYRGETYDAGVDIYSLGLVLYRLRNHNRLPFLSLEKQLITYRDKETAFNRRMSGEEMPPPAQAGEALAKVILKASAYRAENRYKNPEEFRKALEELKNSEKGMPASETIEEIDWLDRESENSDGIIGGEQTSDLDKSISYGPIFFESPDKKEIEKSQRPLWIAVLVMALAVLLLTIMFARLVIKENGKTDIDSIVQNVDGAGKKELASALTEIRSRASEIVENLDVYNWIGTKEMGKISYLNQEGQVMKILVYPSLSEEDVYEEYFFWEEQLFMAYIGSEKNKDHYYYKDGTLIRWIDKNNRCHDGETDNEEYVERGKRYQKRVQSYLLELKG